MALGIARHQRFAARIPAAPAGATGGIGLLVAGRFRLACFARPAYQPVLPVPILFHRSFGLF